LKKYFLLLFILIGHHILFSQQGSNIDLDEVVNTAGAVPRISIDSLVYAIRDRDKIITNLLKSSFWNKSFKFSLNLEDYDTGKKYAYQNKGAVRVIINNIELNSRHNFKTSKMINELLINTDKIQIISSKETINDASFLGTNPDTGQPMYVSEKKVAPVTLFIIKSDLSTETVYNKGRPKSKIKKLSDFKVLEADSIALLSPDIRSVITEQTKTIKLDDVEVIKNVEEDGIIYTPKLVNGQITFKKNAKLTRLNAKKDRFKKMGLNEWGIDINANTWAVALRGYLMGKQTGITSDGFPILFGAVTLGAEQPGPLWVIDGVNLTEPPKSVRSLADRIREVKVLKYGVTAKYGSRGAAGVIEIITNMGYGSQVMSYKKSFEVKGKKNIKLMENFQSFEKQFISKRDELKGKRSLLIELNEVEKVDSIQRLLETLELKSYLFTANFAINNSESEVAPYLALTKIADAKLPLLESIEEKLTEKVKNTKYGKRFIDYMEKRRKKE